MTLRFLFLLFLTFTTLFAAKSDDMREGCELMTSTKAMDDLDDEETKQVEFTLGFVIGAKHAYQSAYAQRTGKDVHDGYASVDRLCRASLEAYALNDEKVEFIHILSAAVAKDLSSSNRIDIAAGE